MTDEEDATPLMRFMAALTDSPDSPWNMARLAKATGGAVHRQTLGRIRTGETSDPWPSTQHAIEDAAGLDRGTISAVMTGRVDPVEAARKQPSPQPPGESWSFRLRSLEAAVDRLQSELEQLGHANAALTARLEAKELETGEIRAFVERLESVARNLERGR